MKQAQHKPFLVVAPQETSNIFSFQKASEYIYQILISNPCPELLLEIREILTNTDISGILTRGSLAQYLYANHIPVPVFHLKYETDSILELIDTFVKRGFRKIGIFEIGHSAPALEPKERHFHLSLENYEIIYYKTYQRNSAEARIRTLWEQGRMDAMIGDVEPLMIAKSIGIPCEAFIVDEQAYLNTIHEAMYATDIAREEKAQSHFIEVITNIISEAVIIVDEKGHIQRCNLEAEHLLLQQEPAKNVQELFQMNMETLLALPSNHLISLGNRNYIFNLIPRLVNGQQLYAFLLNNVNYVEDLELSIRRQNRERGLTAKFTFQDVICRDPASVQMVRTAKKYAKSNGTILIYGETGTGKEVIASSIHNESPRQNGPFVAINCAALNENLIESELFGYEKGAFTGAQSGGKRGLFELANKGSIFLDEIGELSLPMQGKLLRVLQEREIMRIGGNKIIPVDVRIIAATNKDLQKMVRQKTFREDLYYRLALLELETLPLRERPGDIIPLFTSHLADAARRENKAIYWKEPSIFEPILKYDWPGNVRELGNFAERAVLLCEDYCLNRKYILDLMQQKALPDTGPSFTTPITRDLKALEKDYLVFLLQRFGGDKERLCNYLGLSKTTLWRKLNTEKSTHTEGDTNETHLNY